MSKKTSLADALYKVSGKEKPSILNNLSKSQLSPRAGKKVISGHFDPEVNRQLKQIALDRNTTIQALLSESLNDFFVKYNLKPIA